MFEFFGCIAESTILHSAKVKVDNKSIQLVLFYILDFIISRNKVREINCNRSRGKKTSLYLVPILVYCYCISQTFGCKCL